MLKLQNYNCKFLVLKQIVDALEIKRDMRTTFLITVLYI